MDLCSLPDAFLIPVALASLVFALGMLGLDFIFVNQRPVIRSLRRTFGDKNVRWARIVLGLIAGGIAALAIFQLAPLPPPEPENVVRLYWERVSNQEYPQAWAMLTPNFRCIWFAPCENSDGNFTAFTRNWSDIGSIQIRDVGKVTRDEYGATLSGDLVYHWADPGRPDTVARDIIFELVPDRNGGCFRQGWLINKTRYGAGGDEAANPSPPTQEPGTPDPVVANIRFCSQPCDQGGQPVTTFDGRTTTVYAAWDYSLWPVGTPYTREWLSRNELWVRYTCVWQGGEAGTHTFPLFDRQGGLRGGEWTLRVVVWDRVVYSGSFTVNDDNTFWDPIGPNAPCPD